eukprot:4615278-Alexandrium_andersonii.AAC.1
MSASLVGSEMCIRDSAWSTSGSGRGTRQSELGTPSPPSGCSGFSRSPEPVSYTHLTLPTICSV